MNEKRSSKREICGFVITKPLQLLVVLAIIDQLPGDTISDLIVVDAFFGAKDTSERLADSNPKWRRASFFKNHDAAYKHCKSQKYDRVFIDSDVGLSKNIDLIRIKLSHLKTRICVYEEGLGSYRSDLYYGFKRKLLDFVGAGTRFGGNWLTKEIYLYRPAEYISRFPDSRVEVVQIGTSIADLIHRYEREFRKLFDLVTLQSNLKNFGSNEVCDIYLTSWRWDEDVMRRLQQCESCRIIKFHPHLKENYSLIANSFDVLAQSNIPAEILIASVAAIFKKVRVMHHGSSATRYLNINNVEFSEVKLTVDGLKAARENRFS
jgi:hypothetical protein